MLVLLHFLYSDDQSCSQGVKPMKHLVVLKRVLPLYVSVAKYSQIPPAQLVGMATHWKPGGNQCTNCPNLSQKGANHVYFKQQNVT
jgi:hypothetical protein